MKVAQSCPTLWGPMNYTVQGILQARMLEWVTFPFARGSSQTRDWTQVSCIAGGFFTNWAIREAQHYLWLLTLLVTCYLFICLNFASPGHCPRLTHMKLLILLNSEIIFQNRGIKLYFQPVFSLDGGDFQFFHLKTQCYNENVETHAFSTAAFKFLAKQIP